MFTRAAHAGAGIERPVLTDGHRGLTDGVPVGGRLFSQVLHHFEAQRVVDFVHVGRVILQSPRGAALENEDG